jgi:hypothetical protein
MEARRVRPAVDVLSIISPKDLNTAGQLAMTIRPGHGLARG